MIRKSKIFYICGATFSLLRSETNLFYESEPWWRQYHYVIFENSLIMEQTKLTFSRKTSFMIEKKVFWPNIIA